MTYKISDECIACGRCYNNCPIGCVEEGWDHYVINEERCVGCGKCASMCPISAISKNEE